MRGRFAPAFIKVCNVMKVLSLTLEVRKPSVSVTKPHNKHSAAVGVRVKPNSGMRSVIISDVATDSGLT